MSAIDVIALTIPAAPQGAVAVTALSDDAGSPTGFAALLGGFASGGDDAAPTVPADLLPNAQAPSDGGMAGLLTGAATFLQIPSVLIAPSAVTATPPSFVARQPAPSKADVATGPLTLPAGADAAQPPAQAMDAPATVTPGATQAATATAASQPAKAAQTDVEALTRAGLTPIAPDALTKQDAGLERLQSLIQDGARRSGLRDSNATLAPGATASAPGPGAAPALQPQTQTLGQKTANLSDLSAPTAQPPPPLDATEGDVVARAETAIDGAPALDHAPAAMAREAASGLSRATIETTAQIAAQIQRRLEGRSTRFEMALTPEGLGRVDVSLDINADGQLAARLAFDNPLAALELRGRADELRRQLQEAGFQLAGDALDFSQRDPSTGEGFDRRSSRAFSGAARLNAETDAVAATPARWLSLTLTPEGVDMKV